MSQKKEIKADQEVFASPEIKEIIENITKEYGEGIITTLGKSKFKDQPTLSTGSIILDREIGGGYPFGKIIELYGENASGKTTLALHAHAQNIGVDIDKLLVLHPEYGEQAFKLLIDFIKGGAGIIVIDSLAPLIPMELLGDFDKQVIGAYARMVNNGLRQINHEMTNRETIIIFINQLRNKISTGFFIGNPKTTTGGVALTYYATQIIKNRSISSYPAYKDSKEKPLEIMFKGGIQKEREIFDLATDLNVIQKSGSWYSYAEKKLGQGKENAVEYLIENPELYQEIEKNTLKKS
ncbi:8515_t:CDS:2, partial [Funneliformis geosporum]